MSYISVPNLPINRMTHCLVSQYHQSVLNDFIALGITVIPVAFCCDVSKPIAYHADIVCHHLGGKKILLYEYNEHLTCKLLSLGLQVIHIKSRLGKNYPDDILLNAARVGKWLICHESSTDDMLMEFFSQDNIIHTKQGYAKCSTLIVDENSIITADSDIAKRVSQHGIDVLLIQQEHIRLDGYPYGFIGGCGGKLDQNTIYFTGKLDYHPDCDRITKFLKTKNIDIVFGSSDELLDVGSIIPLLEQS